MKNTTPSHTRLLSLLIALAFSAPAQADFLLRIPIVDYTPTPAPAAPALAYSLAAFDQSNSPLTQGYAFGNVPLPESRSGIIRVTNQGTGTVTLASVTLTGAPEIHAGTGAYLCAVGMVLDPSASCFAYPGFTPAGDAGYLSTFSVSGNHDTAVAVSLSGTGTTTTALNAFDTTGAALTGEVSFGGVTVGQVYAGAGWAGTVQNTGTGVAYLQAPTASAGDFSVKAGNVNNCAEIASLSAGGSCNVYASFAPSAVGTRGGAYTLTSTAGQSVSLALTGAGVAIVPTLGGLSVPSGEVYGTAPFALTTPNSNSSGAWTYASDNAGVATVSGNTVTVTGVGYATITATQAASGNYASAATQTSLTVAAATPVLGSFSVPTKTAGSGAFAVTAPSSDSSGTWSYTSSDTGVASVSGGNLTPISAGTTIITANQAASGNYAAASTSAALVVTVPVSYNWTEDFADTAYTPNFAISGGARAAGGYYGAASTSNFTITFAVPSGATGASLSFKGARTSSAPALTIKENGVAVYAPALTAGWVTYTWGLTAGKTYVIAGTGDEFNISKFVYIDDIVVTFQQ